MPTVTQLWPSGGTHTALGSGELTNPTNVSVDDSATFATQSYAITSGTFGDKYGNFGLSIPAGSTINQVQIKYQGKKTGAGSVAITGHIFWNVGGSSGTDHTQTLGALAYQTYDVTSERSWASGDFADGTFFVSFEFSASTTGANTGNVNALYAIVTYTPASGVRHIYVNKEAQRRAAWW